MDIPKTDGLKRGAKHRVRRRFVLAHPEKTNRELAELLQITPKTVSVYRQGTDYKLGEGSVKVSREWVKRISKLLAKQGIANTLVNGSHKHSLELADGRRVRVAYCGKTFLQRQYPVHQFAINKDKFGEYADFFVLVAGDIKSLYVVPDSETPENCRNLHIPAMPEKDKVKKKPSKYTRFLNNFTLLRQPNETVES